nr:alpha/beta hydrolase fold-1 [Tanacetum cinerariifolium]
MNEYQSSRDIVSDGSQCNNDTVVKAVLSRYLLIFLCNRCCKSDLSHQLETSECQPVCEQKVSQLKSLLLRIYATNLTFSALPLDTCLD